jgi:hypothetical protein
MSQPRLVLRRVAFGGLWHEVLIPADIAPSVGAVTIRFLLYFHFSRIRWHLGVAYFWKLCPDMEATTCNYPKGES